MSETKQEFGVFEPFEGIVGYHIEKCNDQQCSICKFTINGHCKWGLDKK